MAASAGKFLTRKGLMEKERAMSTAKNTKDSKFGTALLKNNFHQNRLLVTTLGRLDNQLRRQQMHIDQQKKRFLNRKLPEPSIIVERPASPEKFTYDVDSDDSDDYYYGGTPSYMKPLKRRVKTPSNLPTIDAFVLKTKKKANLWEEAMDKNERPQFQSTVLPSPPLTQEERNELHAGWLYHRPVSKGGIRTPTPPPSGKSQREIKSAIKMAEPTGRRNSDDGSDISMTFVTQLSNFRYNTDNLGGRPMTKSVKFSSDVDVIREVTSRMSNKASITQHTSHSDADVTSRASPACPGTTTPRRDSKKTRNELTLLRELTRESPRQTVSAGSRNSLVT